MARLLAAVLTAILVLGASPGAAPVARAQTQVDLELVLAVDVSGSVDEEEAELQRRGYLEALASPRVVRAIQSGPHGRIALTYLEWAGTHWQRVIVGWTEVSDAASALAFASAISETPVLTERRTSISAAIDYAVALFDKSPFKSTRRVIDISGDGPNNRGRSVLAARDEAVARGIVINGLPIINDRPNPWGGAPPRDLDLYYQEYVIGGPGAFMVPARGFDAFGKAVLAKLIREIAGLPGPVRAAADMYADAFGGDADDAVAAADDQSIVPEGEIAPSPFPLPPNRGGRVVKAW